MTLLLLPAAVVILLTHDDVAAILLPQMTMTKGEDKYMANRLLAGYRVQRTHFFACFVAHVAEINFSLKFAERILC